MTFRTTVKLQMYVENQVNRSGAQPAKVKKYMREAPKKIFMIFRPTPLDTVFVRQGEV